MGVDRTSGPSLNGVSHRRIVIAAQVVQLSLTAPAPSCRHIPGGCPVDLKPIDLSIDGCRRNCNVTAVDIVRGLIAACSDSASRAVALRHVSAYKFQGLCDEVGRLRPIGYRVEVPQVQLHVGPVGKGSGLKVEVDIPQVTVGAVDEVLDGQNRTGLRRGQKSKAPLNLQSAPDTAGSRSSRCANVC